MSEIYASKPTQSHYPSKLNARQWLNKIRRAGIGILSAGNVYKRNAVGREIMEQVQPTIVTRKIAITSPKGGTGKTSVAVNLAVCLALNGIKTYLVDADGNTGTMKYHLRLNNFKSTLSKLLQSASNPSKIVSNSSLLDAFTPMDDLPTLMVLPGLDMNDLGDISLQHGEMIDQIIAGLYKAGAADGGVVIMDVGVNPFHPIHRAALRHAEEIDIVIKPEIPDLSLTYHWITNMIDAVAVVTSQQTAAEFIRGRVKICYNMVVEDNFKKYHGLLQNALEADKQGLALMLKGVLPYVDYRWSCNAINGKSPQDILAWRYQVSQPKELALFAEAILGFACCFVPSVSKWVSTQ
jgi:MinD-like ATPase involved in chromosome partitioning or flagellar assembly